MARKQVEYLVGDKACFSSLLHDPLPRHEVTLIVDFRVFGRREIFPRFIALIQFEVWQEFASASL